MPHIIIETSKNILARESLKIGQEIQQIMKKIVEGNFDPDQCKIRVINCKHVFHSECLDTWLLQHDYKCPHCREKVAEYKSDLKS